MYPIQTTPGFIVDSRPYGDAGKIFSIFTRDFGLVAATAQGIRLEKSKLRYHAREHTFGVFSFVRGKEYWRLTSASNSEKEAPFAEGYGGPKKVRRKKESQELLARVALVLKRLLHGEESYPDLFDTIKNCADHLGRGDGLNEVRFKTLESLTVLRIVYALGYVKSDKDIEECLAYKKISDTFLEECSTKRLIMNQHINRALKESHL